MKNDELSQYLKQALRESAGWEGDEIATDRTHAINYYFQRARGDEVPGRSQLVDNTVSAMVEANLAQILDAFSSDEIVEFDPTGPEDEDQAQLESDTVTHFVMKRGGGFLQLANAVKSALMMRNGVVKEWCEDRTQTATRTFDSVEPEVVDEFLAQLPPGEHTVVSHNEGVLKVRSKIEVKQFRSESIEIQNFFYPRQYDSFDVQDIPFCAERHVETRSKLVERGFPKAKVDDLTPYQGNTKADSDAQNPGSVDTDSATKLDPSQDRIEWFECYALIDNDGDGIAERRRIAYHHTDDVILEDEPVLLVPYAVGAVMINPHRLTGISQYDKLRFIQDERTALRRARADNINTTTKNRLAYLDDRVNVDDINDGRTNGAIRVSARVQDVRQAVMPFAVPDTSGPIGAALQDTKTDRTEAGGAALELASGQLQIGGDRMGSQGLDRAYSVMEQLAAMMTKITAATLIRNVFLLAHATLREHWDQPVHIKKNGKWMSATPSEWPVRDRVTVKVGMSPGERARKANALMQMLQSQVLLAEKGMDEVLVNVEGFYRALMDWARVSEIQNPEQYFVDPTSDAGKAAIQSKQKQAAEMQQQKQQLLQNAVQLEQLRVAQAKYEADQETQFKYWAETLRAEIEEAKLVGHATTELIKVKNAPKPTEGSGEPEKQSAAA